MIAQIFCDHSYIHVRVSQKHREEGGEENHVAILAEVFGVNKVIPLDTVGEFGFEGVERCMRR